MKTKIKYDFSGYATKNGLKCSDGRTILKDAFKHQDGKTVPLVWQHLHNEPINVLGHALLENREDGMYCYGKFNDTEAGKNSKALVEHGDISSLSIYANQLTEKSNNVIHGAIREVSLVLSGANPGAFIDNLSFTHSDGTTSETSDEAIIYTGLDLAHEDNTEPNTGAKEDPKGKTMAEIFETLNAEQKNVVYAMITHALGEKEDSGAEGAGAAKHSNDNKKGDTTMKKNVFDKTDQNGEVEKTLSHADIQKIVTEAQKCGSLREAVLQHATTYGIENIDFLFPDAKTISDTPEFIKRRTEWVSGVIGGAKHSPFSRIKSLSADITLVDARAKGYIKGNMKKEEFFALAKRVTTPTTIYKKQKLDRDDIIDITDFNVVSWIKSEMRVMLDEELARAILVGDGREADDPDKINETNIRPIAKDNPFYAHQVQVPANTSGANLVESILRARTNYKGSGTPAFYTTESILTDLLLIKDKIGRRLYSTEGELASALRVSSIIPVEVMEGVGGDTGSLIGIMVNIRDYVLGADKGGQVGMFDDFDIDYNQYKYLMETRCSGTLTKAKSAVVFWRANGILATPIAPTYNTVNDTITIPTVTGVNYTINGDIVTGNVVITEDTTVDADPNVGYYFAPNTTSFWTFIV